MAAAAAMFKNVEERAVREKTESTKLQQVDQQCGDGDWRCSSCIFMSGCTSRDVQY